MIFQFFGKIILMHGTAQTALIRAVTPHLILHCLWRNFLTGLTILTKRFNDLYYLDCDGLLPTIYLIEG